MSGEWSITVLVRADTEQAMKAEALEKADAAGMPDGESMVHIRDYYRLDSGTWSATTREALVWIPSPPMQEDEPTDEGEKAA